jgi:hypothetical protein
MAYGIFADPKSWRYGSPNGLETMSENLMLKPWFRNQVAPPLKEKNDQPKIGASFG